MEAAVERERGLPVQTAPGRLLTVVTECGLAVELPFSSNWYAGGGGAASPTMSVQTTTTTTMMMTFSSSALEGTDLYAGRGLQESVSSSRPSPRALETQAEPLSGLLVGDVVVVRRGRYVGGGGEEEEPLAYAPPAFVLALNSLELGSAPV